MRCLISNISNPHFNLAAEEYFLKSDEEDIFMLYINKPCLIVGKHQNLLSEINLRYVIENNIKLARRISGGGTVYQDENNLNFCFISNCISPEKINLGKFTQLIFEVLQTMGLQPEFSQRNDLLIESKKISGNAMHIYKNRVLSHGTLLFNTDFKNLSESLKNNPQRYLDKSIKSVRSEVTNLSNHLGQPLSMDHFTHTLFQHIINKSNYSYQKSITADEEKSIQKISCEKFETWDWTYGYSPKYVFKNSFVISNFLFDIELSIERGFITDVNTMLSPDSAAICHILNSIIKTRHDFLEIMAQLKESEIRNSFPKVDISEFCYQLF